MPTDRLSQTDPTRRAILARPKGNPPVTPRPAPFSLGRPPIPRRLNVPETDVALAPHKAIAPGGPRRAPP
jgi:hypothetical protein